MTTVDKPTGLWQVLRWPISPVDMIDLVLPWPARILSVAASRVHPTDIDLWSLAEIGSPRRPVRRRLYIAGTGHPRGFDIAGPFIGTAVTSSGLVWHVFVDRKMGE